jgi:hypothetical protein
VWGLRALSLSGAAPYLTSSDVGLRDLGLGALGQSKGLKFGGRRSRVEKLDPGGVEVRIDLCDARIYTQKKLRCSHRVGTLG